MSAQFYGYAEPQCISGPRITRGKGAQWDTAEAVFLCTGPVANAGGFTRNSPFPDAPGFIIDGDPETEAKGNGHYETRLLGRGIKSPRVYSMPISTTASEVFTNLEVGGVPYQPFNPAWPEVNVKLHQMGFRQIVVGATSIGAGDVGQRVSAPYSGPFPPAPANPFSEIDKPRLNFPWGWILDRRDAEPLIDGPYSQQGPWILTLDYVYVWKFVPGNS